MSKKEGRYYVEYLGWKEASGLFGREFTEAIVRELLARRRSNDELPKMTIKINPNEIQISQEAVKKPGAKPEKTKYPAIPTKDCTFVIQCLYPDNDVVACIFLGYNPYTKCAAHVHVYRFDSASTATMFANHLNNIIDKPDFKKRILGIEQDLAEAGYITIRRSQDKESLRRLSGSDGVSYGTASPHSSESLSPKYPTADEALKKRPDIVITKSKKEPEQDPKLKNVFSSLHEELEYKMNLDEVPILLPPKDYDTIVRRHGHLEIRDQVKATSRSIVGPNGIFSHMEAVRYNGPVEDFGIDRTETPQMVSGENGVTEQNNNFSKPPSAKEIKRSSSDTYLQLPQPLQRQSSFASSERSNNSDDLFADGLYQGYKPKAHKRSKSREERSSGTEDSSNLAMWSPSFSFGQTGIRKLPTHHEEDHDALNRTAPAGMITHQQLSQPPMESVYVIKEHKSNGHHVRRAHSQNYKNDKGKYRIKS